MQLISTVHEFALCLNQRDQSDVLQLLLDFCKEFDKVPHYQVTLLLLFIHDYHYRQTLEVKRKKGGFGQSHSLCSDCRSLVL